MAAPTADCVPSDRFEDEHEDCLFPYRKNGCEIYLIEVHPYEENLSVVVYESRIAPLKMKVVAHGSADLKEHQENVGNRFDERFVVVVANRKEAGPAWKSLIALLKIVKFDLAKHSYLELAYE